MVTQGLPEEAQGVGIAVGYALFVAFESTILYYHFKEWILFPDRRRSPPPEYYLHAAIHTFM